MNHMNRGEETQVLAMLDALAEQADRSQRQLSSATGLNLAKVNFLLKSLVEKGHVKFNNVSNNPNKLAYLYILTPQGVAEKARLTYRFIERTLNQYQEIENRVKDGLKRLAEEGAKKVVVVGSGEIARVFLQAIDQMPELHLVGVVDLRQITGPTEGNTSIDISNMQSWDYDRIVIADIDFAGDLDAACRLLGVDASRVWAL